MGFFGCLLLLGFIVIAIALSLLGRTLDLLGATVVWLWESFLNLFRPMKKEVHNPWTGISNFDKEDILEHERRQREQERRQTYRNNEGGRPKMYDKDDGEYIDFKEI